MADSEMKFIIPTAAEFCQTLRKLVTEMGGYDKFFENLSRGPEELTRRLGDNHRGILSRLLGEPNFRERFTEHAEEDSRSFLYEFLKSWEVWSELSPVDSEFIKLDLLNPNSVLLGAIPRRINDAFSCISHVYLDLFSEQFRVKTVITLIAPDKQMGGPENLVIASTLTSFLTTISLMLQSITFRDSEIGLCRVPSDRPIIGRLIDRIAQIEVTVANLRKQFEGMQ